jgi:hypothetical protein
MPISTTLKCKGLYSFPNKLGALPEGALVKAENVVINRNDVIEPRRGFAVYSSNTSSSVTKQLMYYKNRILRHFGTTIQYDNGSGTFTGLTGTFVAPTSTDGKVRRIKSVEANGNLYFTTANGIKKLSLFDSSGYGSTDVVNAGGTNALDTEVALNSQPGFFAQDSIVSYRVVWGIKDNNNNLILGAPSGRSIISNPIQSLLVKDFNKLLTTLDDISDNSSSDLLSNTNYVSSFKLASFALESNIKSNLKALGSALDSDFTITDSIALSSVSVTNNVATLTFTSDVSNHLKADDVILISTVAPASNYLIGYHTITSVSTNTVTFQTPSDNLVSTPITGTCNRVKYTIGKFRTNENADITSPILGVTSLSGKVYVRFSSDISDLVSVQDVVVISGMLDEYSDLNGSQIVTDILSSGSTSKDIIAFKSARSDSSSKHTISFDLATEEVLLQSHGLTAGTQIEFETTGTLPDGLSSGTVYYVANSPGTDKFKVSATSGGAVISLAGTPTGTATLIVPKKENKSNNVKNASFSVVGYQRQLILSDTATTKQLEDLQGYYQDIVSDLQLESPGMIAADQISKLYDNNATTSSTVNVRFTIPASATTNHFYQIYRTTLATSTDTANLSLYDPGDEHRLVYEGNPSSSDITAGFIQIHDVTPESFLGANLYTNPASGEGLAQANDSPPLAQDIALFKGYTFYANTQTKYRKKVSLNSVQGFKKTITEKVSSVSCSGTIVTINFEPGTNLNTYAIAAGDAVSLSLFNISGLTTNTDIINSCFRITGFTTSSISFRRSVNTFPTETKQENMGLVELIKVDKTLTITDGTINNVYSFQPETHEFRTITTSLGGSSVAGKYFTLNSANDVNLYYVWYDTGSSTDPALSGKTAIKVSVLPGDSAAAVLQKTFEIVNSKADFNCSYNGTDLYIENSEAGACEESAASSGITVTTVAGYGEDPIAHNVIISTAATPGQQVDESANSLIRVVNKYSNGLVYAQYLSSSTDVPGQINFESRSLGSNAFYFNVSTALITDQFNPTLPVSGASQIASNDVSPNRIYYSKYQQPEAVPLLNYIDVGPKDKAILRIVALRDSLFVFKEDAIYRLSGEVAPFIATLFDSSANLGAPDTAAVLNNNIYMMSNQGVSRVSETGVQVISRPIEDLIVKLNDSIYPYYSTASFGLGYESDRSYYLFTLDNYGDQVATKCYRYNIFTDTWTVFTLSKTCAVVHPAQDRLYLGASDINDVEKERKNFDRLDYADRQYDYTISPYCVNGAQIIMTGYDFDYFSIGDSFVQTQYLTIKQFNRLLEKLDLDSGVVDSDYVSTLSAVAGDTLSTKVNLLATKLDSDPNLSGFVALISGYTSSFVDTQAAFNAIVDKLNADPTVTFTNYQTSSGTVVYEIDITAINRTSKTLTTRFAYPLVV